MWYAPTGISAEYAGGFGIVAIGSIFTPLNRTELDISVGYTPPAYGNIFTANILFSYKTIQFKLNDRITMYPFNAGVFLNFNMGDNIYIKWPSYYPDRYYWWNSAIRFGPFVESEVKCSFHKSNNKIGFFFQCFSNDFYISSFFTNTKTLAFTDILFFGTGIKYYFRKNQCKE